MRTVFAVILLLLLSGPALPQAGTRSPEIMTIVVYDGVVDAGSVEALLDRISDGQDSIIGLNLVVRPPAEDAERYYASFDEERLVVMAGDPMNAPREVVINGGVGQTREYWTVDGFYSIRFGGMHAAGAMSWGAMLVDEEGISRMPNVRMVRRRL